MLMTNDAERHLSWTFFLVLLFTASVSSHRRYDGYELLRIHLPEDSAVTLSDVIPDEKVDIWREPRVDDRHADVMVPPSVQHDVKRALLHHKVPYQVLSSDINGLLENNRRHLSKRSVSLNDTRATSSYMSYDQIIGWLNNMAERCQQRCLVFNVGRSYEGRVLRAIRIGESSPGKSIIWIDAGLHAREWIAPATALVFIEKLILGSEQDENVKALLSNFTWYILPMANPDGYHFTWVWDRLWRKTRSSHPYSRCRGADPNRNWEFHWSGPGTSSNPCSENYRGSIPFSEPETRAMANFLHAIKKRTQLYLTLHSYGQFWLTPWGYTRNAPHDLPQLISLAKVATDKLRREYNTSYTLGTSARSLYLASGGSDDWAKGVAGIKYSYTVELAKRGPYGFLHSPSTIKPVSNRLFEAVKDMAFELSRRLKKKL